MIDSAFIRTMARYNKWQNNGLRPILERMPHEELTQDRGAFFGSIFATANHLLWGDMLWMSRFDGGEAPPSAPGQARGGIVESVGLTSNIQDWLVLRHKTDGRIVLWADGLRTVDLVGNLTWYSGAAGKEMSVSKSMCIMHFFNHQTHHRGQIHAMLTAAGQRPIDSDLFLMPEEL
ncbi:DinB family protein [Primorskyibacter sp. S187A]|uniref:DinB family protein n=1 Tax=Primorskyibacter sp. S187A TaxID=3415130 RepID=UPI003C7E165B